MRLNSRTRPPFIEQLIGTMRREYLNRIMFWNGSDLLRKLGHFGSCCDPVILMKGCDPCHLTE